MTSFRSIRGKIIVGSTLLLILTMAATLYTGFSSSVLARSVGALFSNNRYMENLLAGLSETGVNLLDYLTTKSSDSLKGYILSSTKLAETARKLNREVRDDEPLLLQRNLAGLIDSYLREAEASVSAKRGRDVEAYTEAYGSSVSLAELARFLVARISGIFLSSSLEAFSVFETSVPVVLATDTVLVLAATLMGLMLMVRYAYKLTEPLSRLAEAARAVGRGEYDSDLPVSSSGDEVSTTAAAFASMRDSVKRAFEELREKAEVERTLMEEQLRVLDMDHKLKDAELLALQTQINPHFLYNTISAGMQLALTEGADRTAEFLDKLASFIRYVLKPPSRAVFVSDEIECVERYIWLLKLRFGDRFSFDVIVAEAALSVETPALMLQPLVENAVVHGLRDREKGGTVSVRAFVADDMVVLEVTDNGEGMDAPLAERILADAHDDESLGEGSIGLRNVMRRASLATGGLGRLDLTSTPGAGTSVRVYLPAGRHT